MTFGGAFSNHIRAVAAAGHALGLATVGVIRGEEHLPLNDSLAYAVGRRMRLSYLDRSTYRRKADPDVLAALIDEFGPCYVVPEGRQQCARGARLRRATRGNRLGRYVLRFLDADARRAEPVSSDDERALADQVAAVADGLRARADRRDHDGEPLRLVGSHSPMSTDA